MIRIKNRTSSSIVISNLSDDEIIIYPSYHVDIQEDQLVSDYEEKLNSMSDFVSFELINKKIKIDWEIVGRLVNSKNKKALDEYAIKCGYQLDRRLSIKNMKYQLQELTLQLER